MGSPITDRTILHQPYPLVIVGDYDTQGLADWVTMPNVEAVRTAVGALLDSGCRRIALIGGTAENACPDADRESRPETTSTMRTRGYVLAHEERGLQVDWRLVRNADWVQSGGRDAVAGLLDDPDAPRPDAVMCLNDALAIGVIHELQRRGVRVPQDMQVIGFDNVPDAEYCMPGLTTIDPHVDDSRATCRGYADRAHRGVGGSVPHVCDLLRSGASCLDVLTAGVRLDMGL